MSEEVRQKRYGEGSKNPRFQIEKLEERIAPRCYRVRGYRYCDGGGGNGGCHYNPQGKMVGNC
jgi:hypothetical protein